jgi:hypothetical protein
VKKLFFLLLAVPFIANAQMSHYIGLGTYMNLPMASGTYSLTKDDVQTIRFSPFINYTLETGIFNVAVGLGGWQSSVSNDLTTGSGWNGTGFDSSQTVKLTINHQYAFIPVEIGVSILNGEKLKLGLDAHAHFKYLVLVNWVTDSNTTHFNGSELDAMSYNKFVMAFGGGAFMTYVFGRVDLKLQAGYLQDINDVYSGGTVNYSFANPYAALALRYRLFKPEDK